MDAKLKAAGKPPSVNADAGQQLKPRKKRKWGGVLSGLVLGAIMLCATRLGYIWPVFDILSSLTAHALILIGACLLAAIVPRGKSLTAIVLFILGIVIYGTVPLASRDPGATTITPSETSLKIGHYNVRARNKDEAAIEQEIRALDADVLVLLEFTREKLPLFANLRSLYPHVHTCIGQGKCASAIISKIPFAAVDVIAQSNSPPSVSVQLGAQHGSLTVVGVHLQRVPNLQRQLLHFSNLRKLLEPVTGHIVLTGDFNATNFSRSLAELEAATGLVRQTSLPTWPAHFGLPQLAIDHILLSRKLKPLSKPYAGNAAGSDHLPLAMHIAIPK